MRLSIILAADPCYRRCKKEGKVKGEAEDVGTYGDKKTRV